MICISGLTRKQVCDFYNEKKAWNRSDKSEERRSSLRTKEACQKYEFAFAINFVKIDNLSLLCVGEDVFPWAPMSCGLARSDNESLNWNFNFSSRSRTTTAARKKISSDKAQFNATRVDTWAVNSQKAWGRDNTRVMNFANKSFGCWMDAHSKSTEFLSYAQ